MRAVIPGGQGGCGPGPASPRPGGPPGGAASPPLYPAGPPAQPAGPEPQSAHPQPAYGWHEHVPPDHAAAYTREQESALFRTIQMENAYCAVTTLVMSQSCRDTTRKEARLAFGKVHVMMHNAWLL